MSENKILCPGAYPGSTGLVSEAALENDKIHDENRSKYKKYK
jgi:hypothetical protein